MRSPRALLASFGAALCLIVAGTLAMVSLSTFVAFSGLPGPKLTPPVSAGPLVVAEVPEARSGSAVVEKMAPVATLAPAGVAGRVRARPPRRASRATRGAASGAGRPRPTAVAPADTPATATPPGPATPPGTSTPQAARTQPSRQDDAAPSGTESPLRAGSDESPPAERTAERPEPVSVAPPAPSVPDAVRDAGRVGNAGTGRRPAGAGP